MGHGLTIHHTCMYGLQKPHNGPQDPRLELDCVTPEAGLCVPLIVMDQGLKLCTRDLEMPERDGV